MISRCKEISILSAVRLWMLVFMTVSGFSCAKGPQKETEVYNNDFENGNVERITNGRISTFDNTRVLGRYKSEDFTLLLKDLPEHDLVKISFDLNIHDSWDGNQSEIGGPDLWEFKAAGDTYISATFSNIHCPSTTFCAPQSYPRNYPNSNNNPRNGASRIDMPKACQWSGDYGTTQYRIERTIRHSGNELTVQCLDKLVQTNADNGLCDESWSVDNMRISVIALK